MRDPISTGVFARLEEIVLKNPAISTSVSMVEFARLLGVHYMTARDWRARGLVPARRDGKSYVIDPLQVYEFWQKLMENPGARCRVWREEPEQQAEPEAPQAPVVEPTPGQQGAALVYDTKPVPWQQAVAVLDQVVTIPHDRFEAIRQAAVTAAREAYRDEILGAADLAEKRDDVRMQARLLKEYVHAEECFRVSFGGEK